MAIQIKIIKMAKSKHYPDPLPQSYIFVFKKDQSEWENWLLNETGEENPSYVWTLDMDFSDCSGSEYLSLAFAFAREGDVWGNFIGFENNDGWVDAYNNTSATAPEWGDETYRTIIVPREFVEEEPGNDNFAMFLQLLEEENIHMFEKIIAPTEPMAPVPYEIRLRPVANNMDFTGMSDKTWELTVGREASFT